MARWNRISSITFLLLGVFGLSQITDPFISIVSRSWITGAWAVSRPMGGFGSANENLASMLSRLKEGHESLKTAPKIELAKLIIDEAQAIFRRLSIYNPECNSAQGQVVDIGFGDQTIPCLKLEKEEEDKVNHYRRYFYNPLVNAVAMAENLARTAGDASVRETAFPMMLEIVPRLVDPRDDLYNPSAELGEVADVQESQAEFGGQATSPEDLIAFKQNLIIANETRLLHQYWLYRAMYKEPFPESDDGAIYRVISRTLDSAEYQELAQVVSGLRQTFKEANAETNRLKNRKVFLTSINDVRLKLASSEMKHAEARFQNAIRSEIKKVLNGQMNPTLSYDTRVLAKAVRPELNGAAFVFGPEIDSIMTDASEVFYKTVSMEYGLVTYMVGDCKHQSPYLSLPAKTEAAYDTIYKPKLVRFFNLLTKGQGEAWFVSFEKHLKTQQMTNLGTGPYHVHHDPTYPTYSIDRCGNDRGKVILDFLDKIFKSVTGFSSFEDARAYYASIEAASIIKEPLLISSALRSSYQAGEGYVIETKHLDRALEEQASAILKNAKTLAEIESYNPKRSNEAIARLIQVNPIDAWRLVAWDWSYLGAIAVGYGELDSMKRRKEIRDEIFLYAGTTLAVLSMLTLVGSVFVVEGAALYAVAASGALGVASGAFVTGLAIERSFVAWTEYEDMRRRLIIGLGGNSRELDLMLAKFNSNLMQAVLSGALMAFDAFLTFRSISTLRQLKLASEALAREHGFNKGVDLFSGTLTRVPTPGRLAAQAEAGKVMRAYDRGMKDFPTTQAWIDDIVRRLESGGANAIDDAERIAVRMRASHAFGEAFFEAVGNGYRLHGGISSRILVALREGTSELGATGPNWMARITAKLAGKPMKTADDLDEFLNALNLPILQAAYPKPTLWQVVKAVLQPADGSSRWAFRQGLIDELNAVRFQRGNTLHNIFENLGKGTPDPELVRDITRLGVWWTIPDRMADIAWVKKMGGSRNALTAIALAINWIAGSVFSAYVSYHFFVDSVFADGEIYQDVKRRGEFLETSREQATASPYGPSALPFATYRDSESGPLHESYEVLKQDLAYLEWMCELTKRVLAEDRVEGNQENITQSVTQLEFYERLAEEKALKLRSLKAIRESSNLPR